ncbi:hypothetical protein SAMN02799631_04326 [Methylobacterium sp. 174MFSha1.1]|uniref:hypothetical protein n=1 Tax=Methylobacterium sp. 174MFSha1.1 TaxID=1502749 RepID=UPI0008DF9544|nr:hypothetical protein [Methylobacterium sp. 174MFSha1.1]SFV05953.1 hypothetical protein SAMN02799631_04326 [Methylobacterium sp. 174MFSha1.1]
MARIARSALPLYQTRGRPIAWRIRMSNPDGSALDLTGCSASVTLHARGVDQPLSVGPLGPDGVVEVSGANALSSALSAGNVNELRLALTDSQGTPTDYVWPVIGEDP